MALPCGFTPASMAVLCRRSCRWVGWANSSAAHCGAGGIVGELVEAIGREADREPRMTMVALEYRVRMMREQWVKQPRN